MAQDRIKTYIRGFDDYLEGGLPKGHVVLFSGTPGTLKSSICWNILWHNARTDGRRCLYLSLEQSEKSLLDQMGRLGMSPDAIGGKGKLAVIDLGTIRAEMASAEIESDNENWSKVVQGLVGEQQEKGLEVIAIDSLDAYELLFERQLSRNEMFHFFEWLRRLDITVLLIAEMSPDSNRFSKYDESFLADGIIHLKLAEISDVDVQRRIRCVKMRGTKHAPGYHSLLVDGGQFAITKAILE